MRILVADSLYSGAATHLERCGFTVHSDGGLKESALLDAIKQFDPDVLVVRSTQVQSMHIEAASSLGLIVRAGAGTNNIDIDSSSSQGIYVANCPGRNADAVAELAIGLLVAVDRRIPDNVSDLRAERWDKESYAQATGLKGRTLGILGAGRIGRAVAVRAKAFGMRVKVWSRSMTAEIADTLGVEMVDTPEVLDRESDALSIHLALNDETRGLVGREFLEHIKSGAYIINTSRAEILDAAALLDVIDKKALRVALDVFPDEPTGKKGTFSSPLASHPRVYGTHHIGASTQQAQEAVALEVCRIIESHRDTGVVPNCVNLAQWTQASHCLIVRHRDRVGVLATVLDQLKDQGINVQEMENTIFRGAEAASARLHLNSSPNEQVLQALRGHEDIFHAVCVRLTTEREL